MLYNSFHYFIKLVIQHWIKFPPNFSMNIFMEMFNYFDVQLNFVYLLFSCLEIDGSFSDKRQIVDVLGETPFMEIVYELL